MMHPCDFCGDTILFGGIRDHSLRFCNRDCAKAHHVITEVPNEQVEEESRELHQGSCPVCEGPGPVDAHPWYTVYSLLIFTSHNRSVSVSCLPCGRKKQLLGIVLSLVFGWWSIPSGILLTPVQIGGNILALRNPPHPARPSQDLEDCVRISLSGLE